MSISSKRRRRLIMNNELLKKSFFDFKTEFDFNELVLFMDKYNLESSIKSNYLNNYILQSSFDLRGIHNTDEFINIFNDLNNHFNLNKRKSDLEIFFSFTSGASGTSHKENYDVYIVGLLGNTVYKIEDKYFEVEKGDVLTIPKNTIHKSIALTPRIILSYAVY